MILVVSGEEEHNTLYLTTFAVKSTRIFRESDKEMQVNIAIRELFSWRNLHSGDVEKEIEKTIVRNIGETSLESQRREKAFGKSFEKPTKSETYKSFECFAVHVLSVYSVEMFKILH